MKIEKTHAGRAVQELLNLFRPDARALPGDIFWLAVEGTEAVGVLAGHHDWTNWDLLAYRPAAAERASWIAELFVVPSKRSLGIGSALVAAFIEDAQQTPNQIALTWPSEADENHPRRVQFFRRLGFEWATVGGNFGQHEPWLMFHPIGTYLRHDPCVDG